MNKSSLSYSRDFTPMNFVNKKESSKDSLNRTEIDPKQPTPEKHIGNYIAKKLIHSSLTAHSKSSSTSDSKTIKSFNSQQESFQVPTSTFSAIANSSYLISSNQGISDIQSIDDFISKLNKIFHKVSEDRPQVQESYTQLMKAFKKFDLKAEIDKKINQPISKNLYNPTKRKNSCDDKLNISTDNSKRIYNGPEMLKIQPEERIRILEKQNKDSKLRISHLEEELKNKEEEFNKISKQKNNYENNINQLNKKVSSAETEITHLKNEYAQMSAEYSEKEKSMKLSLVL